VGERSYVAVLQVHLFFPESGSLKAKRAELNRVKAHLRNRHGASVAEVGHQDTWQRSTLAVALAGRSPGTCDAAADDVVRYLDAHFPQGARVERRVASWTDLESLG
jgi:uncharacterized protein YlxP (DUF503 family)